MRLRNKKLREKRINSRSRKQRVRWDEADMGEAEGETQLLEVLYAALYERRRKND